MLFVGAWILGASALGGCSKAKPVVGQHCSADEKSVCGDSASLLACSGGLWSAVPCRGPAGCSAADPGTKCDDSGSKTGDACLPERSGQTLCSDDRAELLSCAGGHWAGSSCKGVGQCVTAAGESRCSGTVRSRTLACR